jgi:hypothetical protein
MSIKTPKPQPATREKTCRICGASYTYPMKESAATRHTCELCSDLPAHQRKVLTRMSQRIEKLERALSRLSQSSS